MPGLLIFTFRRKILSNRESQVESVKVVISHCHWSPVWSAGANRGRQVRGLSGGFVRNITGGHFVKQKHISQTNWWGVPVPSEKIISHFKQQVIYFACLPTTSSCGITLQVRDYSVRHKQIITEIAWICISLTILHCAISHIIWWTWMNIYFLNFDFTALSLRYIINCVQGSPKNKTKSFE